MKVFDSNKLTHTLQTWSGMVLNHGQPQQRFTTSLPRNLVVSDRPAVLASLLGLLSDEELSSIFIPCVLQGRIPKFKKTGKPIENASARRFNSNIHACCDSGIDVDFMKRNVRALNRLDLEQAAAVVISSIRNDVRIANRGDIITALIKELDTELIAESCMWLESHQRDGGVAVQEAKFARLVDMVGGMLRESQNSTQSPENGSLSHVKDWASLMPLLLRIRRKSPQFRCLFIPRWIFDAADVEPPSQFMIWGKDGTISPGHEPIALSVDEVNDVILSRKRFRSLQRRLLRFRSRESWGRCQPLPSNGLGKSGLRALSLSEGIRAPSSRKTMSASYPTNGNAEDLRKWMQARLAINLPVYCDRKKMHEDLALVNIEPDFLLHSSVKMAIQAFNGNWRYAVYSMVMMPMTPFNETNIRAAWHRMEMDSIDDAVAYSSENYWQKLLQRIIDILLILNVVHEKTYPQKFLMVYSSSGDPKSGGQSRGLLSPKATATKAVMSIVITRPNADRSQKTTVLVSRNMVRFVERLPMQPNTGIASSE
ncbi:MAG: hypothetical protein Q9195_008336 [Heterodermia aff. obscurata]